MGVVATASLIFLVVAFLLLDTWERYRDTATPGWRTWFMRVTLTLVLVYAIQMVFGVILWMRHGP